MATVADRRRANGPSGGTIPVVFTVPSRGETIKSGGAALRGGESRKPDAIRKIFLRKGVVPAASGSSYLELAQPAPPADPQLSSTQLLLHPTPPTIKLICSVHGPKPVPRSAPFSTNLLLNTHVKYAPFATSARRGYVRDSLERDLAVHLETALRAAIIAERWPKSGVDVVVTVLEGGESGGGGGGGFSGDSPEAKTTKPTTTNGGFASTFGPDTLGSMSVLAGAITAASVALADAGIDAVDLVIGGVAALVPQPSPAPGKGADEGTGSTAANWQVVQDPVASAHGGGDNIAAACVVGYLRNRDEFADVWMLCGPGLDGDEAQGGGGAEASNLLLDGAVRAATAAQRVAVECLTST